MQIRVIDVLPVGELVPLQVTLSGVLPAAFLALEEGATVQPLVAFEAVEGGERFPARSTRKEQLIVVQELDKIVFESAFDCPNFARLQFDTDTTILLRLNTKTHIHINFFSLAIL